MNVRASRSCRLWLVAWLVVTQAFLCACAGFLQVLQVLPRVQKHIHQIDWRLQIVTQCVWISAVRLVMDCVDKPASSRVKQACPQPCLQSDRFTGQTWFLTKFNIDPKPCRCPHSASATTSDCAFFKQINTSIQTLFVPLILLTVDG